ncbi:hypothetical protein BHE74_00059467 [Ensete ventricosum]|nr:hypothetical protein BHE74_00059467 [Ensete ventricosum]
MREPVGKQTGERVGRVDGVIGGTVGPGSTAARGALAAEGAVASLGPTEAAMATGPRRCHRGGGEILAVGCGKKRQLGCPRREMRASVGAACRRPKRTVDLTSSSYQRL